MQIIGKTQTGKDIFDVASPGSYGNKWSDQDHKDAAEVHKKHAQNLELGSDEENFHSSLRMKHYVKFIKMLKIRINVPKF